jgi:hypothetical protein
MDLQKSSVTAKEEKLVGGLLKLWDTLSSVVEDGDLADLKKKDRKLYNSLVRQMQRLAVLNNAKDPEMET